MHSRSRTGPSRRLESCMLDIMLRFNILTEILQELFASGIFRCSVNRFLHPRIKPFGSGAPSDLGVLAELEVFHGTPTISQFLRTVTLFHFMLAAPTFRRPWQRDLCAACLVSYPGPYQWPRARRPTRPYISVKSRVYQYGERHLKRRTWTCGHFPYCLHSAWDRRLVSYKFRSAARPYRPVPAKEAWSGTTR